MNSFDMVTITNWVISGFIGLVFGIVSAWVTHRYQKERDTIAWEREKEKLRYGFELEKKILEIEFHQRLVESEQKSAQLQSNRIRDELLKGVDTPDKSLEQLIKARKRLAAEAQQLHDSYPEFLVEMTEYQTAAIRNWLIILGILFLIYAATR